MAHPQTTAAGRARSLRLPWRIAVVAVVFLFCCGSLRQDELECEEAVAYLDHCCNAGSTTRGLNCVYVAPQGCCNDSSSSDPNCGGHNPDLDEQQSTCVRKFACSSLCAALAANITLAEICPP